MRNIEALRASTDVFADAAAVNFALAGIGRDEGMRRSFAFLTSENFFSLMGVEPALGRFYNAEECRPNANIPVVVVSHGFWKRMGGRPDFVGSTLQVNGQAFTVIGISPEGFSGISALIAPDVWLPLGIYSQMSSAFSDSTDLQDLAQPKNYTLNVVARLQTRPDDRLREAAAAGARATSHRFATGRREWRRARTANPNALAFQHQHDALRRRAGDPDRRASHGHGRGRVAHRELEPGEHAAGPRHGARQRNRPASCPRREPLAHHPPAFVRRVSPRCGWRARSAFCSVCGAMVCCSIHSVRSLLR